MLIWKFLLPWLQVSFLFQSESENKITLRYCFQLDNPNTYYMHCFCTFYLKKSFWHKNWTDSYISVQQLCLSPWPVTPCLAWSLSFWEFEKWHHAFHYTYHPPRCLSLALHILCSPSIWVTSWLSVTTQASVFSSVVSHLQPSQCSLYLVKCCIVSQENSSKNE